MAFSNYKKMLELDELPDCIAEEINRIYYKTFGWNGAFDDINKCIKGQKRFYYLTQDPVGIISTIFRIRSVIERKEYPIQTYFHKDISANIDFLNTKHNQWKNPYDSTLTSNESFHDLYTKAMNECIKMIGASYNYVYSGEPIDMHNIIGNASYYSNLSWDDSRNDCMTTNCNIFQ